MKCLTSLSKIGTRVKKGNNFLQTFITQTFIITKSSENSISFVCAKQLLDLIRLLSFDNRERSMLCEQLINWNNTPCETVVEYQQNSGYLSFLNSAFAEIKPHFGQKKRLKDKPAQPIFDRNVTMLCLHQHISMVNSSDVDDFVCENKMIYC